jgi:ethanolamine ammonia-lyase small subunit
MFEVSSQATCKQQYLQRPDLGRKLSNESISQLKQNGTLNPDVQIVIGDGLSALATLHHAPPLLDILQENLHEAGLSSGNPFYIRFCRVGIVNDIGDILKPKVVILLIGERPGLATAESLSAYLAYQPTAGDTDANRNLISNIHAGGVTLEAAAKRIISLTTQMIHKKISGVQLKEVFPQPNSIAFSSRSIT